MGEDDLVHLFDPLIHCISNLKHTSTHEQQTNPTVDQDHDDSKKERLSHIGATVDIKWSRSVLCGTGWKREWYRAEMQGYCEGSDTVTLCYV